MPSVEIRYDNFFSDYIVDYCGAGSWNWNLSISLYLKLYIELL
jgi:hypothetical protein